MELEIKNRMPDFGAPEMLEFMSKMQVDMGYNPMIDKEVQYGTYKEQTHRDID